MEIIFRRSDYLYAGIAHKDNQLNQEIQNICNSELGGSPRDYLSVNIDSWPTGDPVKPSLDADHKLVWVTVGHPSAKASARKSALAKLAKLGLTNVELDALGIEP